MENQEILKAIAIPKGWVKKIEYLGVLYGKTGDDK